jgi:hypothetical protein
MWYRASGGKRYPRIQFVTTDEDVAMRAARLLGNKVHSRNHRNPTYKRLHLGRVTGVRAVKLMQELLPHMGERRSAKIREILAEGGDAL